MTGSRFVHLALAGALACLIIPMVVYSLTSFSPQLTGDERAVLEFAPANATLAPRTWHPVSLSCPVSTVAAIAPASPRQIALVKEKTRTRVTRVHPDISFILHDDTGGMAIVDGVVVKEGSSFNGGRITRIESNRLLLENKKGKQWLSME